MVRTRLLSRTAFAVVGAAALLMTLFAPPPSASAATVYLQIWWVHCHDQSEPGSDELRLRLNGAIIGGWNDVDGGETHWYYSSFPVPLNRTFSGNTAVDVLEWDSEYGLLGWININEGMVGTGQHELVADQYDGSYRIRFEVTANPV